jgi:hypothetical protein
LPSRPKNPSLSIPYGSKPEGSMETSRVVGMNARSRSNSDACSE